MTKYHDIFTDERLAGLFPADRADQFFEALFGDADEGSYDITLAYMGHNGGNLDFELRLTQRPGKCLACNLTYGLPQVFSRHPVINVQGIAEQAAEAVDARVASWQLGATREVSRTMHAIPLRIDLA